MKNYRKYRCDKYGSDCKDCPIKEICFYLFDLPFGKSDTDAYLKIYEQGRTDAIEECIKAIEDSKSLFDNSTKWTMAEKSKLQNKLRELKEQKKEQNK